MERSLTLLDSGVVDLRTIDRVLQAVVFFADSIAIRATFETISGSGREKDVERRISILREQGFLKFWAHEYEVDDAGRTTRTRASASVRPADLVVGQRELAARFTDMDEIMRGMREEAYRDVLEGQRKFRQGTAEIVSLRNSLASLVISSELQQDGLLSNPATRSTLSAGLRSGETFQSAVVREVLGKLELGPLTRLSPEQVVECRRYSADFRKLLDDSLVSLSRGMDPVLTPEATAKELAARYRAISAEFALPKLRREVADDVLWDVMGAALPATLVLKYGFKAFRWRKAAENARPYLLLMHLERALRPKSVG